MKHLCILYKCGGVNLSFLSIVFFHNHIIEQWGYIQWQRSRNLLRILSCDISVLAWNWSILNTNFQNIQVNCCSRFWNGCLVASSNISILLLKWEVMALCAGRMIVCNVLHTTELVLSSCFWTFFFFFKFWIEYLLQFFLKDWKTKVNTMPEDA